MSDASDKPTVPAFNIQMQSKTTQTIYYFSWTHISNMLFVCYLRATVKISVIIFSGFIFATYNSFLE